MYIKYTEITNLDQLFFAKFSGGGNLLIFSALRKRINIWYILHKFTQKERDFHDIHPIKQSQTANPIKEHCSASYQATRGSKSYPLLILPSLKLEGGDNYHKSNICSTPSTYEIQPYPNRPISYTL